MRNQYIKNKESKIGAKCTCPSCGTLFIKKYYQQAFCKSRSGTTCKDKYWNTIIPEKRNNTTRISPASKEWIENKRKFNEFHNEHPFSSEGLGQ